MRMVMKALVAVVLAVGVVVCAAATARAAEGGEAARVSLGRRGWFDNLLNPTSSLPTTKAFGAFATKPQVPVVPGLRGVAALGKPTDLETMSWGQAAAMSAKELQTRTSALVKYFVNKVTGASSTPQTVTQCMNPQASLWRPDTARLAASAVYLAVEAYNIGTANTPVVVGRNLPWHEPGQQPFTVVYQDLNGRRTKHLGDYTGPFFVAKQGTWLWVAFRGSDTGSDWAHDLTALWTDVSLDVGAGKAPLAIGNMHLGFAEIWQQYRFSETLAALRAKYPDVTRVFYTGHSLGGALAQLAALEHGYKFGGLHPVVFTFGSPRVFGKTLHDDFKRRCFHYRFKHNNDPVPSVPTFDVACTLATAVNLDAELVAAGLDGRCGRRFYHSADSSVRFFYKSRSGEVGNVLSCVNEDNTYVGFNVMDHMSANYGRRVFDLAIEQSRAQGYNFNAGVNLYPPKN